MPLDIGALFDGLGLILQAAQSGQETDENASQAHTGQNRDNVLEAREKERERLVEARRAQMREKRREGANRPKRQYQRR